MDKLILNNENSLSPSNDVVTMLSQILHDKFNVESIVMCSCGAMTLETGSDSISVKPENAAKFFTGVPESWFLEYAKKVVPNYYYCNHCVNHWGLDLCNCGSGELTEECKESDTCGTPSQTLQDFIHRRF